MSTISDNRRHLHQFCGGAEPLPSFVFAVHIFRLVIIDPVPYATES